MLKKSFLLAICITLAVTLWLLSGYWFPTSETAQPIATEKSSAPALMTVQVREQYAQPVVREIVIQGEVEPNRSVTLRAETAGQIEEVLAERGQAVRAGEPIVRIAMDDRQAQLKQAQALLIQRERDYEAVKKLGKTGYQAETRINEAMAELEAARAELERIKLDIEHTVIYAPFDGVLNDRPMEVGDVVSVGDKIALLVDIDPLIVSAQLPQHNIGEIAVGDSGSVVLVTGQQTQGNIRYISAMAQSETRTFRVELEIPNPDRALAVGVSGELRIPVETVATHFLSPAQLSLDSSGALGVKVVNGDETVEFYQVTIVRAGSDGVWVSGLPERARLITVGQGFVQAGERVQAVPENQSVATGSPRVAAN